MKNNKLFIAGLITVFVALVSLTLVSNTWAKYTSTASGTDSARVAKWAWTYETYDTDKVLIDLFDDTYVYELDIYNEPIETADLHVSQGQALIAPGTGGKFELKVTNNSEVTGKVSFDFNVSGASIPLEFKVDSGSWTNTLSDVSSENVAIGASKTVTIYWRWLYERGTTDAEKDANNSQDTTLGIASETVTVDVTINFEQVD